VRLAAKVILIALALFLSMHALGWVLNAVLQPGPTLWA